MGLIDRDWGSVHLKIPHFEIDETNSEKAISFMDEDGYLDEFVLVQRTFNDAYMEKWTEKYFFYSNYSEEKEITKEEYDNYDKAKLFENSFPIHHLVKLNEFGEEFVVKKDKIIKDSLHEFDGDEYLLIASLFVFNGREYGIQCETEHFLVKKTESGYDMQKVHPDFEYQGQTYQKNYMVD